MNKEKLLTQVMEYDFAQYELNLFLDTHPDDKEALQLHKKVSETAKELRNAYESNFGPLTANRSLSEECWTWLEEPWPWEN